ncbi:unnamed protein product [Musa acuminata var. zebrina]
MIVGFFARYTSSAKKRYDLQSYGAEVLQVLLPASHGRRVRQPGVLAEQDAAHVRVLGGRAHVDEGVVVGLGGQRFERPLQRLAGVGVLGGTGPEDGDEGCVGGVVGESGGEGRGVGGVGDGDVDGYGGEALDVGLVAVGVGPEGTDAQVVVRRLIACLLNKARRSSATGGSAGEGEGEKREEEEEEEDQEG